MTVYRDSAGNLIEGPDTTTVYLSSTGVPMDGLPSSPAPYLNAAGQLMGGDPNFPRGDVWVLENDAWDDSGVWLVGKSWL